MKSTARVLSMLGVFALAFAIPFSAGATVKKDGAWPTAEKKVDLEFDGKPSDGLKKLAEEAGWSLVLSNAALVDGNGADVHVKVDDQPADAVLEALFVNHDVVAHRNGTLITVTPSGTNSATTVPAVVPPAIPSIATPTPPSAPPVPTVRGEDRNVFGGSLVIRKDEIVHTVTVAGGSLKVEGTITGDLVVAGGSAKVLRGARVIGNATVFGGSLKIEDDARVDGDVAIAGGSLHRDKGAIIGGKVVDEHSGQSSDNKNVKVTISSDGDEQDAPSSSGRSRLSAAVHEFGQSITKMALLFVLGCVLLALLTPRMDRLRVEVASRPMRSFALGLVGTLLGSISAAILLTVLCITVIGIPVAVIAVLLAILAVYGAIASVLTTAGAAVIGHKTQNSYFHLLIGCAMFLVLSSIPWIGGICTFAVTMIAIGALVTTKVGGLLERQRKTTAPTGLV